MGWSIHHFPPSFSLSQVNIDHQTSKEIVESMKTPDKTTFSRAQQSIYLLMARDSFVRFIKSEQFQTALKR